MTEEQRTTAEAALAEARRLWTEGGPRALTHNALAEATGRSKGNLQHYWRTVEDLHRATARSLIAALPIVPWVVLVAEVNGQQVIVDGELAPDELAAAEAYVWLARHGADTEANR